MLNSDFQAKAWQFVERAPLSIASNNIKQHKKEGEAERVSADLGIALGLLVANRNGAGEATCGRRLTGK